MSLNAYRDEADEFLQAIHASDAPVGNIIAMLQEELDILKNADGADGKTVGHQVYDLLFLLFEIAAKYGFDLDTEWAAGRARKVVKYL